MYLFNKIAMSIVSLVSYNDVLRKIFSEIYNIASGI